MNCPDQDAALFFQAQYVIWTVGMMEPDFTAELDSLSPPNQENWRQVMQRECRCTMGEIQRRFYDLCEQMTDEEALDAILCDLREKLFPVASTA